jgi:hypothetical protein
MKVVNHLYHKFIKNKIFIICFILANFYFFLSSLPLIIKYQRTPQNSYYPLYHDANNYDFNVYLSAIRQGKDGSWMLKDAFTTEITNPTIFYFYYILLGKITAPLNLSPEITYHLGRFFSVEFFIISLYYLNLKIFGSKKILSYFLTITGTIMPVFLFGENNAFVVYFPWWGTLEALRRLDGLPHYLFGFSLLCWSNILIFNYFKKPKLSAFLLVNFIIFLEGILFPPSLIPLVIALPLATLIESFTSSRRKKFSFFTSLFQPRNFILFIFCSTAILSLLVIWRENTNGFPWNIWNKWEIAKWNKNEPNFNKALFLAFGILPIIALPSSIRSIIKGKLEDVYIVLWAYLPFILLPFIDFLGISKFRLVSTAPFIPLGILSAKTIFNIKKNKYRWIILIIFILSAIPVTAHQLIVDINQARFSQIHSNIYISKYHWQAINFLKTNTPNDSIILSNEYIGNIIPAYTHNISYFGHPVHTKDFYIKQHDVALFYENKMNEKEARIFVNKNNISYIYFGPDERNGSENLKYSFLKKVFYNQNVSVFKIQ